MEPLVAVRPRPPAWAIARPVASRSPAVGPGPATPRAAASIPAWLATIAPAGNRAITAAIRQVQHVQQVQRQEAPAADADAPAADAPAEAPLLDAAGIADARRWYTSQPWLYTRPIIVQIRTSLGLGPDGGPDAAMVLAVARFQSTDGAVDDPSLVVDGKAGPRTLPRIFRSGLNVAGQAEAFGAEVQGQVVDAWATFPSARARLDKLVDLVNQRLDGAGVPRVAAIFDTGSAGGGHFDDTLWAMAVSQRRLEADTIDITQAQMITEMVYHEARHAQQSWQIARLRAAQGLSAAGITAETGIRADIATQAKAAPLVRGSMDALIAQGWWDSIYGDGAAHRVQVLTELDCAGRAARRAKATMEADPSPANTAAFATAKARFERAHAAYQELPEENDAWATGGRARTGITAGSPGSVPGQEPPAPVPELCASEGGPAEAEAEGSFVPPIEGELKPPDAPAHGSLPEENLP